MQQRHCSGRRLAWLALFAWGFTASCSCAWASDKSLQVHVDERVELLSVIFHLAGSEEYNRGFLSYSKDIDTYFATFKAAPAVAFAKSLADEKGVGYDAPMYLAVYLSNAPQLRPLVPFTDTIPEPRFGQADSIRMADLARQFFVVSKFHRFFQSHETFYSDAEQSLQPIVDRLDDSWYSRFFGVSSGGHFYVVLSPNNGAGNFGPHATLANGTEERYAILGCWSKSNTGQAVFRDEDYLPLLVHEFAHSFVNPEVDEHWKDFSGTDTVFALVSGAMRGMAYGNSNIMVKESLVRAAVIRYAQEHGESEAAVTESIRKEQANGFLWMPELVSLLRSFEKSRTRYATFDAFMPAVERFFDGLQQSAPKMLADFDQKCAHVKSIVEFANGKRDVDANLKSITVIFDRTLDPAKGYSINYGVNAEYPIDGTPNFVQGNSGVRVPVSLKPNNDYAFVLTGAAFRSVEGYPLRSFTVTFHTR